MKKKTFSLGTRLVMLSEIDWDYLWQRHQIFASLFSKIGVETIYLNRMGMRNPGFKDVPYVLKRVLQTLWPPQSSAQAEDEGDFTHLKLMNPLVLPPTSRLFHWANQQVFVPKLAKELSDSLNGPLIFYTYLPTWTTIQLIEILRPPCVVYDCVQNFSKHPRSPIDITHTENLLLKRADIVVTDSAFLAEKLGQTRQDILRIPPGVDFEMFSAAYRGDEHKQVRTICYFGRIRSELDFALIEAPLKAGYKVRLIGSVDPYIREHIPPEVEFVGQVNNHKLPAHLYDCDVLLLPYKINSFTQAIMPAKTFECLATGKPVISTPLTDIVQYKDLVHIVRTPDDMLAALEAIPLVEGPEKAQSRMRIAESNSWQTRFGALANSIHNALLSKP